jgi:hypothetical protein
VRDFLFFYNPDRKTLAKFASDFGINSVISTYVTIENARVAKARIPTIFV